MAYETTEVSLVRSQEAIRKLIYGHNGAGIVFISHPPREGFESLVMIGEQSCRIRIMATCKDVLSHRGPGYHCRISSAVQKDKQQEERRVWRVLYWHLKAMFESSDSGVIDIRDVILPYVVTKDGRTLSEHLVPRMAEIMATDTKRLLTAAVHNDD